MFVAAMCSHFHLGSSVVMQDRGTVGRTNSREVESYLNNSTYLFHEYGQTYTRAQDRHRWCTGRREDLKPCT